MLGRGSYWNVFLAYDNKLKLYVALKIFKNIYNSK